MSTEQTAVDFWVNEAHKSQQARDIASRLKLDMPQGETQIGFKSGQQYPVRRLVITGEDTPHNMALLFGPSWETSVAQMHKLQRLRVLLDARMDPSARHEGWNQGGFYDQACPTWSPRPASEEEKHELKLYTEAIKPVADIPVQLQKQLHAH